MQRPSIYVKTKVLGAIDIAEGKTRHERIHNVAAMTFTDEEGKPHQFTWRTIQTWHYRYKNHGITAMENQSRADKGTTRKGTPEEVLEAINSALPHFHGKTPNKTAIYRFCIEKGLLNPNQIARNTFSRMVNQYELLKADPGENKTRLAFSMQYANQLWQADTMFGPHISDGKTNRQAKLIAFFDDASRVLCHGEFPLKGHRSMIRSYFGLSQVPFALRDIELLSHQQEIHDTLRVHSQQGGLCLVVGRPGTGKSVIKESLRKLPDKEYLVACIARTLHTYTNTVKILCEAFRIEFESSAFKCERKLIEQAFALNRSGKMLVTIIDDAHLMSMENLRKLRLLLEDFPKNHSLILVGQVEMLANLDLAVNQDIKSRVTYSVITRRLNDEAMRLFIERQLDRIGLAHTTFTAAATELIIRTADDATMNDTIRNRRRASALQEKSKSDKPGKLERSKSRSRIHHNSANQPRPPPKFIHSQFGQKYDIKRR